MFANIPSNSVKYSGKFVCSYSVCQFQTFYSCNLCPTSSLNDIPVIISDTCTQFQNLIILTQKSILNHLITSLVFKEFTTSNFWLNIIGSFDFNTTKFDWINVFHLLDKWSEQYHEGLVSENLKYYHNRYNKITS